MSKKQEVKSKTAKVRSDKAAAEQYTMPMETLVMIATYEMYEKVSLSNGVDVAEVFMDTLSAEQKQVLDRYHNAKIQALAAELCNFSQSPNKNADAAAAKQSAPAQ